MRIVLVSDTFPPFRFSGAVQIHDLCLEFVKLGHDLTVFLPASDINKPWKIETISGIKVLLIMSPRMKDVGCFRRLIAEFVMPFCMIRNFCKSLFSIEKWDGIVFYSPPIFHAPLVSRLKRYSGCKSNLIIRDIFPQWALDLGLISPGFAYRLLDRIAKY